jgi:hypothetical protein
MVSKVVRQQVLSVTNFPHSDEVAAMALAWFEKRNQALIGLNINFTINKDVPEADGWKPDFAFEVTSEKHYQTLDSRRGWATALNSFMIGAAWALGYQGDIEAY